MGVIATMIECYREKLNTRAAGEGSGQKERTAGRRRGRRADGRADGGLSLPESGEGRKRLLAILPSLPLLRPRTDVSSSFSSFSKGLSRLRGLSRYVRLARGL